MRFPPFKKLIPSRWKLRLREWILGQYGVPFSRFNVPAPLVQRLQGNGPITLIDVGASSGDFANSLDQFCGIRQALLVEPIPQRCAELVRRFDRRRFSVVQSAAGMGDTRMEIDILNWDYSSSLLPVDHSNRNVIDGLDLSVRERIFTRLATLDTLCQENPIDGSIDLLKIDVQGAEELVLAGAARTLRKTKAIWIEVSFRPLYHGAVRFQNIYDACRVAGFQLVSLCEGFRGTDGELLQGDALFARLVPMIQEKREPEAVLETALTHA